MDLPYSSPELKSQEELDEWRNKVGRRSILMPLLRQPLNFTDLFSIFEEMMAATEDDLLPRKALNQLRVICAEASAEYGEDRAFWLMVDYTSEEESEIAEQLQPDLASMEDTRWTEFDEIIATVNHAQAESARTLAPEVSAYYESVTGILDLYLPADYTTTQELEL